MDKYTGMMLDGRYELLEPIGFGGMAVVYKARCHRLNRLVAIKILKEEYSKDTDFKRRLETESRAVAMLSHPNIVSVYDVNRSDGLEYIVMELIDGMTLKEYMQKRGRLGWRETLHFTTLIAKALDHAHSRGVIHRDIKPHNIMVLRDGSVKVADFGIARFTSAQHTLTQEALGSVHYISPEQARGSQLDARTDIYSLGVVMYEMLTGRLPYDGESPVAVAIAHINSSPLMPHEIADDVPEGLEYIAMKAMTADLSKRYASAPEMLEDLEEFRKNPNTTFGAGKPQEDPFAKVFESPVTVPQPQPQPTAPRQPAQSQARPVRSPQTQRQREAPQGGKAKKSRLPLIAGILCILLFVSGVFYFLYSYLLKDLFTQSESVMVPQFVGVAYDAISQADYPDFIIEKEGTASSDVYAAGVVMKQSPESGKEVKAGTTIKLTVSTGESTDLMPDVVNTQQQVAIMTLNSLKVKIECVIKQEYSDYVEGYVIRTEPVANSALKNDDTVTLVVSLGPERVMTPMPSIIGLSQDAAIQALTDANLKAGEIKSYANDLPKGTVYFQSVDAGTQVAEGTSINFYVSLGPAGQTESPAVSETPQETQPAASQTPTEVVPEDPLPKERRIVITLPEDQESVHVTVKLNQNVIYDADVTTDQRQITVPVSGSGQGFLDIYFDDVLKWSDVMDLDS